MFNYLQKKRKEKAKTVLKVTLSLNLAIFLFKQLVSELCMINLK